MHISEYYKDVSRVMGTSQISLRVRKKIFNRFMDIYRPGMQTKVLDIGVTCDDFHEESNFFEKMYPYKDRLVCVGVEDGSYLETKYPGIKFFPIHPDEKLPFADKEFDIAFSNAVIEHVGNRNKQKQFLEEMARVSSSFFITTPNRWFPIEFHTTLPFLHYLPPKLYRKLLKGLGNDFWSKEENLNLLSIGELKSLFPTDISVTVETVRLLGISTNILAYATRD